MDNKIDFKRLAEEAKMDLKSKRCFLFHSWSKWETDRSKRTQVRVCLNCGMMNNRIVKKKCIHTWKNILEGPIVANLGTNTEINIGHYYDQKCELCGDLRRMNLRS